MVPTKTTACLATVNCTPLLRTLEWGGRGGVQKKLSIRLSHNGGYDN
jgi:hypothetical protein